MYTVSTIAAAPIGEKVKVGFMTLTMVGKVGNQGCNGQAGYLLNGSNNRPYLFVPYEGVRGLRRDEGLRLLNQVAA